MLLSRVEGLEARARRALALKKYPATVKLLEQILEEVGENPNTLGMLALCCHRTGRQEEALAYAERALEVDAGHLVALRTMSWVLAEKGCHEDACAFAQRGLDRALAGGRAVCARGVERLARRLGAGWARQERSRNGPSGRARSSCRRRGPEREEGAAGTARLPDDAP